MNIKGKARGEPLALGKHLQKDENETIRIVGSFGLVAQDIDGALLEMDALGAGLNTPKTLYHGMLNPDRDRDFAMTEAEWTFARNAYLKGMGFEGCSYIEIEHEKFGKDGILRKHRHIVSALADHEADYTRAIRTDHNYRKHEEISRTIERQLGHEHVQGAHVGRFGVTRPERTPTIAEQRAAERGGVSAKEAKALGAELWNTADSGKALNAALEAHGWQLAKGDKQRANGGAYFMAIDPQGEAHELRRMVPVKAAALYERMADVDAARLPTVREAKTRQKVRSAEIEQRKAAIGRYDDIRPEAAARAAEGLKHGRAAAGQEQENTRTSGPENGREGESTAKAAEHFDRDAADRAWNDAVAASGIHAARKAEQEERRAEWIERHRPATKIETQILDAAAKATGDRQRFDAELKELGLALGRATAADIQALDSERKEEAIAHAVDPQHAIRFIPQIEQGELVAVDRHGGVHRLNQFHLEKIDQRFVIEWVAPSTVTELRGAFAREREDAAKFQQEMIDIQLRRRDEAAHARELRAENREAERTAYRVDAGKEIGGGIDEAGRAATAAPAEAGREARAGLRIIGRLAEFVWGTFFGWAMAPPRMTADQAERAERAEEEQAPARAEAARQRAHDAEYDEMDIRRKYARQLEEQQLAALLGGNATAEAQQGRTKDDRTQERERELRRE